MDDILALYAEQPCVKSSASNIDAFGKSTLKGIIPVIPHVWCPILRGVCSCLPQGRNASQDHGQPPCCSWGRVVSLSMGFCADCRCCCSRLCFCRLRRSHRCRLRHPWGECCQECIILCHDFQYQLGLLASLVCRSVTGLKTGDTGEQVVASEAQ